MIPNQARSLAYLSWFMAQSSLKTQVWTSGMSQVVVQTSGSNNTYTATLSAPGFDLRSARTVWEAANHQPVITKTFNLFPLRLGTTWVEVECQLPDGRRLFATTNFSLSK